MMGVDDPALAEMNEEEFRGTIKELLRRTLPDGWTGIGAISKEAAEGLTATWRSALNAEGLLVPSWPKKYGGGGLPKAFDVILAEECARAGMPYGWHTDIFSIKLLGNTLLRHGTEEQKAHFLPRILSGEDRWCQGFSEPGAGSDLAALSTRATLEPDGWHITGQKLWTSAAMHANWIFVLARTDTSAPKHRGISMLLCSIDQPGVTVRPLKMMSGASEFAEVYFDDARTAVSNVVGEPQQGWYVAMTLFSHERGEDAAVHPILFRAEFDRLLALARETGANTDPVTRQGLAQCYERVEVMRFLGGRILRQIESGAPLGPEASVVKLYWSEYHKASTQLALAILGAKAMTVEGRAPARSVRYDDPGAPNSSASWVGTFYNAAAGTIYAGTSQIQRNILSETVLGLPKEPRM